MQMFRFKMVILSVYKEPEAPFYKSTCLLRSHYHHHYYHHCYNDSIAKPTQLSGKCLSTISLILACCELSVSGEKNMMTYSMAACVDRAVLRCSGKGYAEIWRNAKHKKVEGLSLLGVQYLLTLSTLYNVCLLFQDFFLFLHVFHCVHDSAL